LELWSGSFSATQEYISFKSEAFMVCYLAFRKNQINVGIRRGYEKVNGVFSRNFFTLDDPKKLAQKKSWTQKSGDVGMSYSIPFKSSECIEYVIFLIKQKYETLS
jgi:predicted transport protein